VGRIFASARPRFDPFLLSPRRPLANVPGVFVHIPFNSPLAARHTSAHHAIGSSPFRSHSSPVLRLPEKPSPQPAPRFPLIFPPPILIRSPLSKPVPLAWLFTDRLARTHPVNPALFWSFLVGLPPGSVKNPLAAPLAKLASGFHEAIFCNHHIFCPGEKSSALDFPFVFPFFSLSFVYSFFSSFPLWQAFSRVIFSLSVSPSDIGFFLFSLACEYPPVLPLSLSKELLRARTFFFLRISPSAPLSLFFFFLLFDSFSPDLLPAVAFVNFAFPQSHLMPLPLVLICPCPLFFCRLLAERASVLSDDFAYPSRFSFHCAGSPRVLHQSCHSSCDARFLPGYRCVITLLFSTFNFRFFPVFGPRPCRFAWKSCFQAVSVFLYVLSTSPRLLLLRKRGVPEVRFFSAFFFPWPFHPF